MNLDKALELRPETVDLACEGLRLRAQRLARPYPTDVIDWWTITHPGLKRDTDMLIYRIETHASVKHQIDPPRVAEIHRDPQWVLLLCDMDDVFAERCVLHELPTTLAVNVYIIAGIRHIVSDGEARRVGRWVAKECVDSELPLRPRDVPSRKLWRDVIRQSVNVIVKGDDRAWVEGLTS